MPIGLPKDDEILKEWLIDRGKVHFKNEFDSKASNNPDSQSLYAEAADLLIETALEAGGTDNVSAIVVEIL